MRTRFEVEQDAAIGMSALADGGACLRHGGADLRMHTQRAFLAIAAVLFVVSSAATIARCASMAAMAGRPMPGGWTLSMAWMRMPGQTWAGAAASFLGMWIVMMVAMMLPVLLPMLSRYRLTISAAGALRRDGLTLLAGTAYFLVWSLLGVAVFVLGVALATVATHSPPLARAMPAAAGAVMMVAGMLQFTAWKAQRLTRCRQTRPCAPALRADAADAWRHGLQLGLRCCACCAGATAILLVLGVMDLRVMAAIAVATLAERLAPGGAIVARILGATAVAAGASLLAQAARFG